MIYFDNASTTSVRTEVRRVYGQMLETCYGNPDSLHAIGRQASTLMEKSRSNIASMLHVEPSEIIFTSAASESNTLAIVGYALANEHRGHHVLTSNVEHSSVRHAMEFLKRFGFEVEFLPINEEGIVTPECLKAHMRKDTILVSVMHVNNEMGAINPILELEKIVHQDMATISAHKIHGLKGSAILMKKKKIQLVPIIQGGQQEQGLRGGTENAPANIVLAKTIRLALEEQSSAYAHVSKINQYLREELSKIDGAHIHSPENAIPYILNISFDQITSEVLLNALDQKGICVSAKSTCSSQNTNASEVLLAMHKSEFDATHGIRLSFSYENTLEEAKYFIETCKEIIENYGLSL